MNTTQKIIAGIVLVGLIAIGGYYFPKSSKTTVIAGSSPTGATFGDAKVAAVIIAPATTNATSSGILNTDGSDRYVTDSFVACASLGTSFTWNNAGTGGLLAGFKFSASTSTVATQNGNTNFSMNVNVATTTPTDSFVASSTEGFPLFAGRRWASGTYEVFTANATNTAVCTVGLHYVSS